MDPGSVAGVTVEWVHVSLDLRRHLLQTTGVVIRQCAQRARAIAVERRAVHQAERARLQCGELADRRCGREADAGGVENLFRSDRGTDDLAARQRWPISQMAQ